MLLACAGTVTAEQVPGDIGQRLDRIERLLEGQALIDMHDQLQRLQSEVRQMRGDLETQQRHIERLSQRLEEVETAATAMPGPDPAAATEDVPLAGVDAIDAHDPVEPDGLDDTETVAMLPPLVEHPDSEPGFDDDVVPVAEHDPAEARTAYSRAFDLLKAGQYEQAVTALQSYLHNYPDGEDAGNAQYWLGEVYYVTRDYEQAIAAYQKLIETYPGSAHVPQAKLKLGYSQHELGDIASARTTLQNVRQQYTGSTVARLAEDRLQQLAADN